MIGMMFEPICWRRDVMTLAAVADGAAFCPSLLCSHPHHMLLPRASTRLFSQLSLTRSLHIATLTNAVVRHAHSNIAAAPAAIRRMSSASSSEAAAAPPAAAAATDVYKGKSRVYTKTGDKGTTSLFNMERRSKADDYFQALGDTDELNANLGVVRAHCHEAGERGATRPESYAQLDEQLAEVQSRLFDLGAHLATPRLSSNAAQCARTEFDEHHVGVLEAWIDAMEAHLAPLRNFILPSGGLVATHLHVCRAVCRRAERQTVALVERGDADAVVQRYLNRLSDYLFVAARFASLTSTQPETIWKKPRTPRAAAAEAAAAAESASNGEQ